MTSSSKKAGYQHRAITGRSESVARRRVREDICEVDDGFSGKLVPGEVLRSVLLGKLGRAQNMIMNVLLYSFTHRLSGVEELSNVGKTTPTAPPFSPSVGQRDVSRAQHDHTSCHNYTTRVIRRMHACV
jgi:hypothetical protein